ncbi:hypothetical protein [Tropicimonas sediminicola]|uniref:Dihydroorotate dehydrogenase n=1 Tax=Tropicimonas sediminicola TaxID=1031541 RepID=A0A239EXA5_9RHOB|nr:hypothetical protein [Tropicimonas sediminicola]SNS48673.1 hypothetical protein SAMN05421757_102356 [Tropicimonas sediminicola]
MTTEQDKSRELDAELEAFFQSARDVGGDPSPALLSRVLADAYAEQDALVVSDAAPEAMPVPVPEAPRRGLFAGLLQAVGGWPAMAGLVTATAAGIWIGYNPPAAFDTFSETFVGGSYALTADDSLSMASSLPDYAFLLSDS